MAEHQAGTDRVLAADDVDVRAADRRRRDPDDGFAWSGMRTRDILEGHAILTRKDDGFHGGHWLLTVEGSTTHAGGRRAIGGSGRERVTDTRRMQRPRSVAPPETRGQRQRRARVDQAARSAWSLSETCTGMPCCTLAVTMQKSSKSSSQRLIE